MDRAEVESSNLRSVGYDEEAHMLEIEFNNGSVYQYCSVLPHVYKALIESSSIGKYFNKNIRGDYEGVKV